MTADHPVKPVLASSFTENVHRKFDFRWEVLDVIVGGKSLLDEHGGLTAFPIASHEEASRFLVSYGIDDADPIQKAEIQGNVREAINFIRKNFIETEEDLKLEIPRKILELTDPRDLLMMGTNVYPGQMNDSAGRNLRNWACAVLKVVHAINQVDKDIRSSYFGDIQTQIFDRFYKVIHRDDAGNLYLGEKPDDPLRVDLVAFETKPKKTRESVLTKLLHKPQTDANDIFDRVGLRFVTRDRLDALRVIKYLKDEMIVMPANIKASRSRNNLINIAYLKQKVESCFQAFDGGHMNARELEQILRDAASDGSEQQAKASFDVENPHSSSHYRSIQFTARQLIKLNNPVYQEIRQLKNLAKSQQLTKDALSIVERIDLKYIQREVRFFYPYEIQVVDEKTHHENERGRSAHSEYKKAQTQTARKRVLGSLLER